MVTETWTSSLANQNLPLAAKNLPLGTRSLPLGAQNLPQEVVLQLLLGFSLADVRGVSMM